MSLSSQLTDALRWCQAHRDQKQELALSGGLDVWLYVDQVGANHLQLRRFGAWPSDDEAETVLRLWPQPGTPKLAELEVSRASAAYNCVSMKWKPGRPEMTHG